MFRITPLLLSVSLVVLTGESAFAAPPESPIESMASFLRNIHRPFAETSKISRQGRRDLVFQSRDRFDRVMDYYKEAYRLRTTLPGKVTCLGYFTMPEKRLVNFTLLKGNYRYMVSVRETADGTRLELYGIPKTRAKRAKTRPFNRGLPAPRTLRYGL